MRPVHVVKCLRLMAKGKGEVKVLDVVVFRKSLRSYLVAFEFKEMQSSDWYKMVFEYGIVG